MFVYPMLTNMSFFNNAPKKLGVFHQGFGIARNCSPCFPWKKTPYIGACLNPVTVCKLSIDLFFMKGTRFFNLHNLHSNQCFWQDAKYRVQNCFNIYDLQMLRSMTWQIWSHTQTLNGTIYLLIYHKHQPFIDPISWTYLFNNIW